MAGLKTIWIVTFLTLFLAACVPQTKQTECKSNEAFNSSLRTCVPVVQEPTAFINVDDFIPKSAVTKFKDDNIPVTFQITVSNPYNQNFTIEWERVYNGSPIGIPNTTTSYTFPPSLLASELGTHIITVKLRASNGAIVDSHSFEIKINDLPRPVINTASLIPAFNSIELFPNSPAQAFSFTIKNNGAVISGANYRTIWSVTKNGVGVPALNEVDAFSNTNPTGTNAAQLGTVGVPSFNPATLGVGNYLVLAQIVNTSETVAEYQWNVKVKNPDLGKISSISLPAPGVTIQAHHGIDYNDYPSSSWIYSGTTQPNFCVTLDDADGTYAGDGKGVQVKFYLDGLGGDICTKESSDLLSSQTICLNDANPCDGGGLFDVNILRFFNTSSTVIQNHKVTARAFDKATSMEYARENVTPTNGSYPIEWLVRVDPVNSAPVMSFGTLQPTGCSSAGTNARTNCQVSQGTPFTVSFKVTDDFYSPSTQPENFNYNVNLKFNGTDVAGQGCSKGFGSNMPAYGTQWTCTLTVPHFLPTGPLSPLAGTFSVVVSMEDNGSPVSPLDGRVSQPLSWNLAVTETNTSGVTLAAQGNNNLSSHIARTTPLPEIVYDPNSNLVPAVEGETVNFRLQITDAERDNFKYRISLCTVNTPSPCSGFVAITSPTYLDFLRSTLPDPTLDPIIANTNLLYTLPEDLLLSVSPIQDVNTTVGAAAKVYFRVDVSDTPSVPTTTISSSFRIFELFVQNKNPAPEINTASASPAVGTTTTVFSGYQFTIDPGSVTDASIPASEKNIQYKWYAKRGVGSFEEIIGATERILRYTPGSGDASVIELKLCVGDRPTANPVSSANALPQCSGSWFVTPKDYIADVNTAFGDQVDNEVAVWHDTYNSNVIYSAYAGSDKRIYVSKTVKDAAGNLNTTGFSSISFDAIRGQVTNLISNLSLSGTDDSLYVSYLASTNATPTNMVPRIRRIDKDFNATVSSSGKTSLPQSGKFGFNYDHYSLSSSCISGGNCSITLSPGDGTPARITFNTALTTNDTISINGSIFTAVNNPTGTNQICDSTTCPTTSLVATNLANKINASPDLLLQGITAVASGSFVELHGQWNNDFLDFDGSIGLVPNLVASQNGLGKIFVQGNYWFVPVINASLSGNDQNNIVMISGEVDKHLRNGISLSTADQLSEMGKVSKFASSVSSTGELIFARISGSISTAGSLGVYRYSLSGQDWTIVSDVLPSKGSTDILLGKSFQDVKLAAATTGNSFHYVLAQERSIDGGEWNIARYTSTLSSGSEDFLENLMDSNTLLKMEDSLNINPEIIPMAGLSEARILFQSSSDNKPYLAKVASNLAVSCADCAPLHPQGVKPSSFIGYSLNMNSASPLDQAKVTLGTAGPTVPTENQNYVVYTIFSGKSGIEFDPDLAIINIESESIQSSTVDPGFKWRPPFVR